MSEPTEEMDFVRIPTGSLAAIHRVLRQELGPVDAARALREIGLDSGPAFYERFRNWIGEESNGGTPEGLEPDAFWEKLSDFFEQLGWGRLEPRRVHPGVIAVSASPWAEARASEDGVAGCHLTTGLLAEMLRQVAGNDLAALEVHCDPAEGGSSRILIGSPTALDEVYVKISEGAAYEEALAALA